MKNFSIELVAQTELEEGVAWFEAQRGGLGDEFAVAVRLVLVRIRDAQRFATAPISTSDDHVVRREFVDRFGYAVVFVETDTQRRVIMVRRGSSDPARWQSRV